VRVGLLCSSSLGLTGPDVYLESLIEHLVKQDELEVYLIHDSRSNHPVFKKANEIIVPPFTFLGQTLLRKFSLDILHFNIIWDAIYFHFLKVKKVATVHGDIEWAIPSLDYSPHLSPIKRLLDRVSSKCLDAFIAVSNDLKDRISRFLRIQKSKIYVTYLAPRNIFYQLKKANGDHLRRSYGIEKPFILHVSNFGPKKNPETIFKTLKILINDHIDVDLVMAGGGWKNEKYVQKLVTRLGLHGRVKILGFVPIEDLNLLYNSAEVFFQPSFHENCPQTLLEAMACGTPVVTSSVYSIPEVTGNAGILHDPKDYVAFAGSIKEILTNEEHQKELQQLALKNVKRFSWEKTTQQTIEIYRRLASQ